MQSLKTNKPGSNQGVIQGKSCFGHSKVEKRDKLNNSGGK